LTDQPRTRSDEECAHPPADAREPQRLVMALNVLCRTYVPRPSVFEEILMSGLGQGA
jgi:hypothetical protein